MKKVNTVIVTLFEKAVFDTVNYLCEHWDEHKLFRHKKQLLAEFGIRDNNYASYEKGERNLPTKWHGKIREILVNKYKVNPYYLDNHKGTMFLSAYGQLKESTGLYGTGSDVVEALRKELKDIRSQKDELQNKVTYLEDIVKTQKDLIEELKKGSKKSAKISAKPSL